MQLAIMQPYIFPYLGYFQLINAVDKFIFYDDVNFIKRGWVNRNNILINGKASLFSIPLTKPSQNNKINETRIIADQKWKHKFLTKVAIAYKKAPYFETVFPLVEESIESNFSLISDLAIHSIQTTAGYLGINTVFQLSSKRYPDQNLKGQHRILDICMKENAKAYINPIGGKDIYSSALFSKNDIDLFFIQSESIHYKQFQNSFISNLSIIDVLMFNDVKETRNLLSKFNLVTNG